jgi:hypothetical protein
MGNGFNALIPNLVQALQGKLGGAPLSGVPQVASGPTQYTTKPNPYGVSEQQWQEMNRPGEDLAPSPASPNTSGAPAGGVDQPVRPPAMFIAPEQRPVSTGQIPDSYYASIRSAESGGNDRAKNPTSTATGRYQFLQGTWQEVAKKHPELGLTADGRFDAGQQERAIRAFTADNAAVLRSKGVPITNGSLYAAHFLGAGAAPAAYRAAPNTPMSAIVSPAVIQANGFLRGMNAGQFRQWAEKKGNSAGGSGGMALSGPTYDQMSRPSGSEYQPPMQDYAGGGGASGATSGLDLKGDFNTKLAAVPAAKKRSGSASVGSGKSAETSGGGAHKNTVSPDYKRYQARKNIRHLRGMSPVATIQALENIGKGLRTQGGGR